MPRMLSSRARVVVVDDQDDVRHLLRLRLERTGHFDVVGEGADGHEAIALCTDLQPDVAVVDAAMPVMNGLEAVPAIIEASPTTAVIIFTAESGLGTRNEAERVGAHAVIGKLDPFERLVDTIFRLVPRCAPAAAPAPADPGIERMTSLLSDEGSRAVDAHAPPATPRRGASARFLLLAFLVLLPGLAFLAWVLAGLSGLAVR